MNATPQTGNWKNWRWSASRFAAAPWALKAYTLFSVLASLYAIVLLIGRIVNYEPVMSLRKATVPVTGWAGPMMYFFGLYFAFALLFLRDNQGVNRPRMLFGMIGPLIPIILAGILQMAEVLRSDYTDNGNPYLEVSRWQPVWTIALPVFWIVVLLSPAVKKFCKLPYQ